MYVVGALSSSVCRLHARKVFKGARLPDGRLNPEGAYKNKQVFSRLCASNVDKAGMREQVLSESIRGTLEPNGDPFGDAFISVAVGDEYDDTVGECDCPSCTLHIAVNYACR